MNVNWYYVEKGQRQGPVDEKIILEMISSGKLGDSDFVWKKGMENWQKIREVSELKSDSYRSTEFNIPSINESSVIYWKELDRNEKSIFVRIGPDRNLSQVQDYGPFSVSMLVKLFEDGRINGHTLVYGPGFSTWMVLADIKDFKEIFHVDPPVIEERERRIYVRRPFVARMLFHDNNKLYEGICRDISIGGMQVLVAGFPGKVGDIISLNVTPENTSLQFIATGSLVRILDGDQGFSFRFENLSSEAKEAIERYIKESNSLGLK